MLRIDLFRFMASREILAPRRFLMSQGFSYHMAGRLLREQSESISYGNLEKLCHIFNCTPNDLYSWDPMGECADNKALSKLAGRTRQSSILGKLKQLPDSKLDQIRQLVDKLYSATD